MFENVDTQVNLVHLEHEVMRFWKKADVFRQLRAKNAGKPTWSFLDGPITANNPMGVHHAWGRTYKDVFQRYFAMNGRDLRYQNGFDCQGLWVEIEVEREKGFATTSDIEKFGIASFIEACKERVLKYSAIQAEQSKRLGYWMDWDNSYFTMSEQNNYAIWDFLKQCHKRGFLYKGTDVMPWSGRAGSAYSDMEVKEGRKLTTHTSVFVRFPLRGRENEYLLVWTTTPWTLTSNVGAAVNRELDYVKIKARRDGAIYYLAEANLEYQRLEKEFKEGFPPFGKWPIKNRLKTIAQIFKEQGGYEVIGKVKGQDMIGWTYSGPFDELTAQRHQGGFAQPMELIDAGQRSWPCGAEVHQIIDPGKDSKGNLYVVAGEGTGIVHVAPGCGDVDHVWGRQFGLVSIAPLDVHGCFIEGFGKFKGMNPTDPATTEALLADLREKNLLVAAEEYPHIYPHCWRTGDELVYRLVDEWFISMDWRDEIKKTASMVSWLPPQMKGLERELDWLTTMKDWMISKKRFWGLALPIWECHACGNIEVIGGREELRARAVEGWETFEQEASSPHRPYVDAIKIACARCGEHVSRIPDVGNPWLDAGIVAYSTTGYYTDREYWNRWIPADLITECFPGQFRNWFYALLAMSTMMELARVSDAEAAGEDVERKAPFKTLLGHALVMDENGRQMHKSDGTAIWFEEAAEQIGVDTMRWMFCKQRPTENLAFGLRHPEDEVTVPGPEGTPLTHTIDGVRICRVSSNPADETRRRVLLTLWNSYAFFCNYARIDGFDPQAPAIPVADRPDIDRWILSDLQKVIITCREHFEAYELGPVCQRIEDFINDLSNWYIRRNRRRFWRGKGVGEEADRDKLAAYQTLYEVLLALTRLVAPIVPFITEEMYQNLMPFGKDGKGVGPDASEGQAPGQDASDGWTSGQDASDGLVAACQDTADLGVARGQDALDLGVARGQDASDGLVAAGQDFAGGPARGLAISHLLGCGIDLVSLGKHSVHCADFPVADEALIDAPLSADMEAIIRLVRLGRALRSQIKIGIRQPLGEIVVIPRDDQEAAAAEHFGHLLLDECNIKKLRIDVNGEVIQYEIKPNFKALGPRFGRDMKLVAGAIGKLNARSVATAFKAGNGVVVQIDGRDVTLSEEEVQLLQHVPEGLAVIEDGGTRLALNTELTRELRLEGLAREVIRNLQNFRKEAGLEMDDRIRLSLETGDPELQDALRDHAETIKAELLATEIAADLKEVEPQTLQIKKQPPLYLEVRLAKA